MKRSIAAHFIGILGVLLVASAVSRAQQDQPQDQSESKRKVVNRVLPPYPTVARNMDLKGSVKADVVVAPNGTAKSVEIKGGHPIFAQVVQNAIRKWKWEPAPHETHELVEVNFTPH